MSINIEIETIEKFLSWIDVNTYYELTESEMSDYGDGEIYHHSVSTKSILEQYRSYLNIE